MGLTNKFLPVALMLLLLYLVKGMPQSFECNSGRVCFFPRADSLETTNRKSLYHLGNEPAATSITSNGGNMVVWDQLRKAPSGPDPLHHNGGGSKKPRTP